MNRNTSPHDSTRNENMVCPFCNTSGVTIHTRDGVNFEKHRSYECNDCGRTWTCDEDGNREVTSRDKQPTTPIENDRQVGAVPDN